MPTPTSGGSSFVNSRPYSLGLWHEFCGVLTNFSIQDDSAILEYDDVTIYITITDVTRSEIELILIPTNIGQPVHVLHTDIPKKPYLVKVIEDKVNDLESDHLYSVEMET